jgi:hypothetical protein
MSHYRGSIPHSAEVQHHSAFILRAFAIILLYFARDWYICQRSESESMTPLTGAVVKRLRVLRAALIPHHDSSWLISYTTREVCASVDMVKQELQHIIRFFLIPANDTLCVRGVDEQAFSLRHRMHDDYGMNRLRYRSPQDSLIAIVAYLTHYRVGGGVDCCEAFQTLSEGR